MAGVPFEVRQIDQSERHKVFEALIAGHKINVERHEDWLTTVYWALPEEYDLEDFLRVVEEVFQSAEENGYESVEPLWVAVGSPVFDQMMEYEADRPLDEDVFEDIGLSLEDVNFLRVGGDLAHFTFQRSIPQVGVLFYEKPRQTRSAFEFMAKLLPSAEEALDPKQIGEFVLKLPR